jgi:integrase
VAGSRERTRLSLFRSTAGKTGLLTDKSISRIDAYRMIRRRTANAGFKIKLRCHVFRATGVTAYLEAGGSLENAHAMAAHESPRTSKRYDRRGDEITLDEMERVGI